MVRDTILFDINETILDLSPLKAKFGATFGHESIASAWFSMLLHTSTVCVVTEVKTTFAELAGIMLDTVAARQGVQLTEASRKDILGAFANLLPHPDVKPALQQLRSMGYRTVAFSNSSRELLMNQIDHAGLSDLYDEIVSAEEAASFKPEAKVYQFVAERLNRAIGDLRLVATHDWDTHGAMVAGMQAAYIDRFGAPYHPLYRRPDVYASTMGAVAEQIIARDTEGELGIGRKSYAL
ncbi:MAG: haloacid dehalogenase type II [Merismopedia sp. SIO2A8]|nr:haloacid dehalogenase type II [Merismopedia sp. SIO2A8]